MKSVELNLELYKKLYLIRRSEERIIEHYPDDQMKTPMHMSMGEEAIAAGICRALKKEGRRGFSPTIICVKRSPVQTALYITFLAAPDLMHWVQTYVFLGFPSISTRIF